MAKKNIDYSELKLEFFESDFLEITPFLKHKYSTNAAHGNIKNNTK
ncbi:MAG: hypothetical protein LBU27_06345 [Candidatus Peribacteria bacterium]|nr:hypothetical protein [Candidatus Peribacteria bacterium]